MPLLKADKEKLAAEYLEWMKDAKNVVILKQSSVPVNEINKVRMGVDDAHGALKVIKKRVFLKSIEGTYEGVNLDDMDGSVLILSSNNEDDQHAPLKVVNKFRKQWKKDKLACEFEFVGGWYESVWKDAAYVGELADLPSKEELVSKFLFMLNHPVSSFARVLKAIAEKKEEGGDTSAEAEDTTEEVSAEEPKAEEVTEEAVTETTEEVEQEQEATEESNEEEKQEE